MGDIIHYHKLTTSCSLWAYSSLKFELSITSLKQCNWEKPWVICEWKHSGSQVWCAIPLAPFPVVCSGRCQRNEAGWKDKDQGQLPWSLFVYSTTEILVAFVTAAKSVLSWRTRFLPSCVHTVILWATAHGCWRGSYTSKSHSHMSWWQHWRQSLEEIPRNSRKVAEIDHTVYPHARQVPRSLVEGCSMQAASLI